ncbi:MAG: Uma2 family endonuclease [Pseudomonadota bacterium]
MGEPARKKATYEDLCRVPDHLVAEILAGELHVSPRPALFHAFATSVLGGDLLGSFQRGRGGPGGWWILDEPELHLDEDVLVPDLAGWRRERLARVPKAPAFTLPPDWVCEVLSPGTAMRDRVLKMPIYARAGVAHLWLLDPEVRTLEVFRRAEEGWLLVAAYAGRAQVRAEPFDAVELDLAALWAQGEDGEESAGG